MATTAKRTGEPTKVGAYADRELIAHRVKGTVELRDEPACGKGRRYIIEAELTSMAELRAIVADYTATAARIEGIPMQSWFW